MRSAIEGGRRAPALGWPRALTPAGFVLPRVLRRPARLVVRLAGGDWQPPRFAASGLSAVLIGGMSAYGAVLSGQMPEALKSLTSRTGFALDSVRVTGNRQTSEIDILDRLQLDGWTSLVGFDVAAARERIASLPWIQSVAVRKHYPRELAIQVVEREPFAVWQHDKALTLIEASGRPIIDYSGGAARPLPLVVGAGADREAVRLLPLMAGHPQLAARVKGYVRVGDRRWNLKLDNGVTVKLPEGREAQALALLAELDASEALLKRDIVDIDLRFSDRVVVRLSPDAAQARAEALKALAKKPKGAVAPPKREKRV